MDDTSLGLLACGHRGCPNQAAWRPLVLVFLYRSVDGLPSPIGLRPILRACFVCDRHRRDVRKADVLSGDAWEWIVTSARACDVTLVVDRGQSRLEWEAL